MPGVLARALEDGPVGAGAPAVAGLRVAAPGGRGKGREVGEGGKGGEEGCHLPRSLPKVGWAQVGGAGLAAEYVLDGVVGCPAFRAQ